MRNLLFIFVSIFSALIFASCEDYRDQGLEPDKVFLKNNGTYTVTIPDTESATVSIWAYKSGYTGASATVTYTVGDAQQLEEYNTSTGNNYTLLPADLYSTPQKQFVLKELGSLAEFNIQYTPQNVIDAANNLGISEFALPIRIQAEGVETLADKSSVVVLFKLP